MNQGKGYVDCVAALELDDSHEQAAKLDEILGITNKQPRAEKRARAREFTAQIDGEHPKKAKQEALLQPLDMSHGPAAVAA